jgi:hypothetical protein
MLNKLQAEKLKLQSLILQLNKDISTSKEQLTASFTSSDNSDKISLKISQLQAEYDGLLNGVELNAKSSDTETQRLIDEDKRTDLNVSITHQVRLTGLSAPLVTLVSNRLYFG